jgi:FkbM family methyltransferase
VRLIGITNTYPPAAGGGYGEICADFMESLADRGHDVTMLVAGPAKPGGLPAGTAGPGRAIVRRELDYVLAAWRRPAAGLRATRHDRAVVARQIAAGVDAALVWHMRGLAKPALTLLHDAGIPVLYFLHDRWVLYERAGSLGVPWARLDALGAGPVRRRLLRAPPIEQEGIVCYVSRWLRDQHHQRGWHAAHEHVVPCGVDVERFVAPRRGPPSSPPRRLLFAGRLHPDKGIDVAVRAMARVADLGHTLTIAGLPDRPDEEGRVRGLAAQLGVGERLTFVGAVPRDAMPALLAEHDVLVFPSINVEAYALGLLEALAAGMLVVTSAIGGPREYLEHDRNALIFPAGDDAALAECLTGLDDPARAGRLLAGAHGTAQRISLSAVVDQVEDLLADADRRPGAGMSSPPAASDAARRPEPGRLFSARIDSFAAKAISGLTRFADRAAGAHPTLRRAFDQRVQVAQRRARKAFYAQFLGPGDLAFDIGANMGNRTEVFEELGATVVAVEPQEACQAALAQRYGNHPRVHLVNAGLGPEVGRRVLYVGSESTLTTMSPDWIDATQRSGRFAEYSWTEQGPVAVTTLDRLIAEHGRPRLCKIDVEGFEVEVLRGLSGPLDVVSLEFAAEFLDRTREALAMLSALGAQSFNLSVGESYVLDLETWVDRASIEARLAAMTDPWAFGDVYARFD